MEFSSSLCQTLGWLVLVRVDGVTYTFGEDGIYVDTNGTLTLPNLTNVVVTPTQTMFAARAGPMQVNLTFLNPIEVCLHSSVTFSFLHMHHLKPRDWVKQSIPFSYLAFTAKSLDGASHAVQVYSDVNGGTCNRPPKPVAFLQLRCRVELGGSKPGDSVEHNVHWRCHLPQCQPHGTGSVHRDHQPSGMGHTILCHAGR
jgi:hypothetical protein